VRLRTSWIAEVTGGSVVGPDVEARGASNDSRTMAGGELFVALLWNQDGHDFIEDALRRAGRRWWWATPQWHCWIWGGGPDGACPTGWWA
jgi:UDP-N-acetylmuramyl pentapeptide synthase